MARVVLGRIRVYVLIFLLLIGVVYSQVVYFGIYYESNEDRNLQS